MIISRLRFFVIQLVLFLAMPLCAQNTTLLPILRDADLDEIFSLEAGDHLHTDYSKALFLIRHPEYAWHSRQIDSLLTTNVTPVVVQPPVESNRIDALQEMPALPSEPITEIPVVAIKKPNFWHYNGDYYVQFLQNYISSNWYKGGESSYSMLSSVTLQANYNNKQKVKWDNILELKLGYQTSRTDSLHRYKTTEDLLRFTSKLGLQASRRWYYTIQFITYTQFTKGYKSNDPFVYSDFLSPLNLNLSFGMDYSVELFQKRLTGTVHMAPLAFNFRYVKIPELETRYGLDEGSHTLLDLGSQLTLQLQWKFSDNIIWKTRLYGYTTYRRAELEWENTFSFKFNRYISANVFIYPRFDDSTTRAAGKNYWQLKEFTSLGFSYSF